MPISSGRLRAYRRPSTTRRRLGRSASEGEGAPELAGLGQADQAPAVGGVGQRSAEEGQRQDGGHLHDPDQPHRQRGVREPVDLVGDGDVGDHRPQERDALAQRQEPVVAVAAQGPEVGHDRPPARREPLGLGGGRHLGWGGGESFVGLGHGRPRLRTWHRCRRTVFRL